MAAGVVIKWCVTIAQKICYICFETLYKAANVVSLKSTITHMRLLDFDHCIPSWKSADYTSTIYWSMQPLVAFLTDEKKSGCFCHKECHWMSDNVP